MSDDQSLLDLSESELCRRVYCRLKHLPFVSVQDCRPDAQVKLINPKSIALSKTKDGAAQCFLVIQESPAAKTCTLDGEESEAKSETAKLCL